VLCCASLPIPLLCQAAGGKHLEEHWHKGGGGLRPEGEDVEEEQARLRELQERQVGLLGGLACLPLLEFKQAALKEQENWEGR
jgi:hypothetical protein